MSCSIDTLLGQYKIEVPGNGISEYGVNQIQHLLDSWGYGRIPEVVPLAPTGIKEHWKWDWMVLGKGEYVGSLPKRVGKYIKRVTGKKLTSEELAKIGDIGAEHSGKHKRYWFDIVNHADWGRSDFGQPNSCCFWGCHASAKKMILDAEGGAIRFFNCHNYENDKGYARAWLLPYCDCWIVFNGYGMTTLAIARILAMHLGHAYYRRIELCNHGTVEGELWINGGYAYLLGSQVDVLKIDEIDLQLKEEPEEECTEVRCSNCEDYVDEGDCCRNPDGERLCDECWPNLCYSCEECGICCWVDEKFEDPDGEMLCARCWNLVCYDCSNCNNVWWSHKKYEDDDKNLICETCYNNMKKDDSEDDGEDEDEDEDDSITSPQTDQWGNNLSTSRDLAVMGYIPRQ